MELIGLFFNTSNSGLPDNEVNTITIDSQGNKWIGTDGGLAKFDGNNWTAYNTYNSFLPDDIVNAIAIDSHHNKWIATYSDVLAKFDGTNWTAYNTYNSFLPDDIVNAIAIDSHHNKWIATYSDVLAKFDGTNWTFYNTLNSGLPDDVNAIAIDSQGNKWIGIWAGGLAVYREGGVILDVYEKDENTMPNGFSLYQNYPNPFNSNTVISFQLSVSSYVTLKVFDGLGNEIATLVDGIMDAGNHSVNFDAKDLSSGIFFYQLKTNSQTKVLKAHVLK